MSGTLPANEPTCLNAESESVELVIDARPRDLGGFAVRRVLVAAPLAEVEAFDHPWLQEYFHGPRGRAAQTARAKEA